MQFSKHVSEGRTNVAPAIGAPAGKEGNEKSGSKTKDPEIVVLSTAADVVKGWLEARGDSEGEEEAPPEPELRPPRLGLGAKYLPHAKVSSTLGSLEKRLRANIDSSARQGSDGNIDLSGKRQKVEGRDGANGADVPGERNESGSSDNDNEEMGGRSGVFAKKQRGAPVLEPVQTKKKRKKKRNGGANFG